MNVRSIDHLVLTVGAHDRTIAWHRDVLRITVVGDALRARASTLAPAQ
jgi:hypothetical protein